jgi:hypothetical protein
VTAEELYDKYLTLCAEVTWPPLPLIVSACFQKQTGGRTAKTRRPAATGQRMRHTHCSEVFFETLLAPIP